MEFWNRHVKGESWKEMWPEIVAAGKDQTVSASSWHRDWKKIQQGDNSGSKTAQPSIRLSQLAQRGELTLAENAVEQAAANIGVNSAKDVEQLKLQLRGKYAQLVQEKVAADPNYDIAGNMTEDLEQARDSIVDALSQGPSNQVFQETVGPAKKAADELSFRQADAEGDQWSADGCVVLALRH